MIKIRTLLGSIVVLAAMIAVFLTIDEHRRRSQAELGPDQQGALDALRKAAGYRSFGCVLHQGDVVHQWGGLFEWHDRHLGASDLGWGSASKPFLTTMLLLAMRDGSVQSLDQKIADLMPELHGSDRRITLRQLIDQTSGYSLKEPPGNAWGYNDIGVRLFSEALTFRNLELRTEQELNGWAFAAQRLGPLGIDPQHSLSIAKGMPRVTMRPCDYAKVGWLWAQSGHWKGVEILPTNLVDELKSSVVEWSTPRANDHLEDRIGIGSAGGGNNQNVAAGPGNYGAFWWINEQGRLFPDLPHDVFHANGYWNINSMTIIPSQDLVIAIRDAFALEQRGNFGTPVNDALAPVVNAFGNNVGAGTD